MIKVKLSKVFKTSGLVIIILFILMNTAIIIQAYSLTHFVENSEPLFHDYKPGIGETISIALFGLKVPKPRAKQIPQYPYSTLYIPDNGDLELEVWLIRTEYPKKGFVISFHGYMDEKSSMLDRAHVLYNMGHDVLLVDMMGAGGSYGLRSTIGFLEARNVKACYDYAKQELNEDKIILLGFSMGAAAIIKAQSDYNMDIDALIAEATYATFKGTVNKRLDKLHLPHWPVSDLFTFWTGKINGYDAFTANPINYAQNINKSVLVMGGGKDPNIPTQETHEIFDSFSSKYKKMRIFPESLHESYLLKYQEEWKSTVEEFLNELNNYN